MNFQGWVFYCDSTMRSFKNWKNTMKPFYNSLPLWNSYTDRGHGKRIILLVIHLLKSTIVLLLLHLLYCTAVPATPPINWNYMSISRSWHLTTWHTTSQLLPYCTLCKRKMYNINYNNFYINHLQNLL